MHPTPTLDDFRAEATARRLATKSKLELQQDRFNEAHPGMIETLREQSKWNDFASSLVDQFARKGDLSPKQIEAAERMIAKIAAREEAKKTSVVENSGEVSLNAIEALFLKARENGLKRPKFYAGDVKISLAPSTGRNAGALYIVRDPDTYQGKVLNGTFTASFACQPDTLEVLKEIAKNPADYARMTGKETGRCCCCGRELTDPVSIENGIGPICAENWGL